MSVTRVPEPPISRHECPVLVPEAQTMGALAVIRSLGRGGYPVHAVSPDSRAVGFLSRWASARVTCPSYGDPAFAQWLSEYRQAHGIRAIVPSDSFLIAVRPQFAEYAPLLPCSNSPRIVYLGQSKSDVLRELQRGTTDAARHLPPSLMIGVDDALPSAAALEALGAPLFLKVDASHALAPGEPSRVIRTQSATDAQRQLMALRRTYDEVLIQGFVPGRGVGAFFLFWDGQTLAEFQHRRLHEVPHTGGVSSLRESYAHAAIREDAYAKLRHLQWQGVAMLEYRLDERTGKFYFLELNGRFWGSLHLALYAGVDFPTLLIDALRGSPQPPSLAYRRGVRSRHTVPAEMQYVWSRLKDSQLGWRQRFWSIAEFAWLTVDPRVCEDLFFPGDRLVGWRMMARQLRAAAGLVGSLSQRFSSGRRIA